MKLSLRSASLLNESLVSRSCSPYSFDPSYLLLVSVVPDNRLCGDSLFSVYKFSHLRLIFSVKFCSAKTWKSMRSNGQELGAERKEVKRSFFWQLYRTVLANESRSSVICGCAVSGFVLFFLSLSFFPSVLFLSTLLSRRFPDLVTTSIEKPGQWKTSLSYCKKKVWK